MTALHAEVLREFAQPSPWEQLAEHWRLKRMARRLRNKHPDDPLRKCRCGRPIGGHGHTRKMRPQAKFCSPRCQKLDSYHRHKRAA